MLKTEPGAEFPQTLHNNLLTPMPLYGIIKAQKGKGIEPMKLDEMKANVIRKWGFEHAATLYFFDCLELVDNDELLTEISYEFAMNWPEEE